jgi:hypothetical protein
MATKREEAAKAALRAIPDRNIPGRAVRGFIEGGVFFEPIIGGKDDSGVYRTTYRASRFVAAA